MTESDLHWLAGLLEGEGFFGTINSRVGGKCYRYPRIGVLMSDEDVIARVGRMWGIKVFVYDPPAPSRKRLYRVTKLGKGAVALMEQLRPLMGQRRQAQIDTVLAEWRNKLPTEVSRRQSCVKAAAGRDRDTGGKFVAVSTEASSTGESSDDN
jgi:hypothetical protein